MFFSSVGQNDTLVSPSNNPEPSFYNSSSESLPLSISHSVSTASDATEINSVFTFHPADEEEQYGDVPIHIADSSPAPQYPDRGIGFGIENLDDEQYSMFPTHAFSTGRDRRSMPHKSLVSVTLCRGGHGDNMLAVQDLSSKAVWHRPDCSSLRPRIHGVCL